jgi:hypothetical protein
MHVAADDRADGGREGDAHAVGAEDAHGAGLVIDLADDRVADHRFGAGGHALEHPRQDQGLDRAGKGAAEAGHGETQHAAEQHGPAADPIGERPV